MDDGRRRNKAISKSTYLQFIIISTVSFTFIVYFTIGISLAILPIYLHTTLGYSPTWVGLIVAAQYVATLVSRAQAGRMSDLIGAKKTVCCGLVCCAAAGAFLAAAAVKGPAGLTLAILLAGRLALGIAESWVATGAALWGIGRVGFRHVTRVISWNGIATYGALASGAPFGVLVDKLGGMPLAGAVVVILSLAGLGLALIMRASTAAQGDRLPIGQVFWRVLPHGIGLALGGVGFGIIATFVTLYYAERNWPHAALALTVFGLCFILVRLLFSRTIDRHGGMRVAVLSFTVECLGLGLLWAAPQPLLALAGAALAGCGFSLVFPALGVVAVKRVAPASRGTALGVYSIFIDVSIGLTGPLGGLYIGRFGYSSAFLLAALAAAAAGVLSVGLMIGFRESTEQPN